MWCKNDIWHTQERMIVGKRFRIEDIKPGAGQFSGGQRVDQCILIDDGATTDIDEERTRRQKRQFACADQVTSRRGQRTMQCEKL